MKKEKFILVKEFENYLISENGQVVNNLTKNVLKPNINTSGYYFVNLYKDKKPYCKMIHKLVFESFNILKSDRKFVIDHIDNNKLNNKLQNLQLISNRENSTKDKKSKSNHFNIYKNNNSWLVRLRINGVKKSIGTFKNINDAIIKRDEFLKTLNERN